MKYLVVLALLAAAVSAEEQKVELKALPYGSPFFGYGAYPYSFGYHGLPYAYAAPFRYAAAAAAPVVTAYAAPAAAPVVTAYSAPAVTIAAPAPVAYTTGAKIESTYEPVEQHGYRIAY